MFVNIVELKAYGILCVFNKIYIMNENDPLSK